jgi:hypothetical protein
MASSGLRKPTTTSNPPSQDAMTCSNHFDNPYLGDVYATSPDYALNTFFDSDSFFDQPFTTVKMAPGTQHKPQPHTMFNPTLPVTGISGADSNLQPYNQPPFGQVEQYPYGFSFNPAVTQSNETNCFSPTTGTTSQTPSLCGDAPQQTVSPSLSPHLLKRESPSSPTSESESSTPKRPTRKRGRPRLDRSGTETQSITSPSAKCRRPARQPHNQVERKYREGLNAELERLRRAVPTLASSEDGDTMGHPKPSKAMVLSSAIDYIRKIERERDALSEEVARLRQGQPGLGTAKGWETGGDPMDQFLV